MQRSEFSKKEFIIITAVIALLAAAALIFYIIRDSGKTAVIMIDDKIVSKEELSFDKEFEKDGIDGVVFEIKDGGIRVKSSDCPDKICVHTGFISKEGETIICMPKKLIVSIEE